MAPIPTRSQSRRITESQRQAGLGKGLAYGWQPQSTSKQEQNMKPRMDLYKASPGALPALLGLEKLVDTRSEEHTSELQPLMCNSYPVCGLKKKFRSYKYHTVQYASRHQDPQNRDTPY